MPAIVEGIISTVMLRSMYHQESICIVIREIHAEEPDNAEKDTLLTVCCHKEAHSEACNQSAESLPEKTTSHNAPDSTIAEQVVVGQPDGFKSA